MVALLSVKLPGKELSAGSTQTCKNVNPVFTSQVETPPGSVLSVPHGWVSSHCVVGSLPRERKQKRKKPQGNVVIHVCDHIPRDLVT